MKMLVRSTSIKFLMILLSPLSASILKFLIFPRILILTGLPMVFLKKQHNILKLGLKLYKLKALKSRSLKIRVIPLSSLLKLLVMLLIKLFSFMVILINSHHSQVGTKIRGLPLQSQKMENSMVEEVLTMDIVHIHQCLQ